MNKKALAVAVAGALATPMAAHAVKYKLSGQVNRAMVYENDGSNSDIQFVDNISSGTRWRLTGSEDIGNGMKVGFTWEWQNSQNPSSPGAPVGTPGDFGEAETMRKAEIWFNGAWGKLTLGQGAGAGDGLTEIDLSSTWNVAYTARASFGGAILWRTGAGGTIAGGLTHGATFAQFDAFGRYDRIRYDSPALGPVTLSVSGGARDKYEGAARWSQDLGGGQISAGLFYGQYKNGGIDNRYGGSIAYLFSFGTNLMFVYAENDPVAVAPATSTKGKNFFLKIGQNWGNNSASISYGESKDITVGYTDKGYQLAFNHNLPKAKVDLYAGFQQNSLDVPSGVSGVDDIYTLALGTKLQFD